MKIDDLRKLSTSTLECLAIEAASASNLVYWVDPSRSVDEDASERCRFFQTTGFCHQRNICTPAECQAMKSAMQQLVDEEWHPDKQQLDSFGTGEQQNTQRGDYFLESASRIHFFAEPTALDHGRLRSEYQDNKIEALNKSGHALHCHGVFAEYTWSDKIRILVEDLGWRDPVVPQSMYIFKQAKHGGVVSSHQDSTFLWTEPRQSCLGLWLAIDDATLENGCLWVRPKSHQERVRRQYRRNPEHFGAASIEARSNQVEGDPSSPMFVMDDLYEHGILWDGAVPGQTEQDVPQQYQALVEAGFIPIECQAGGLLAFCGELDHLSLPNHSDKARHTFQLHMVEGPSSGITWAASNWLQYEGGQPFAGLADTMHDK